MKPEFVALFVGSVFWILAILVWLRKIRLDRLKAEQRAREKSLAMGLYQEEASRRQAAFRKVATRPSSEPEFRRKPDAKHKAMTSNDAEIMFPAQTASWGDVVEPQKPAESFRGDGGSFGGAGASASWEPAPYESAASSFESSSSGCSSSSSDSGSSSSCSSD